MEFKKMEIKSFKIVFVNNKRKLHWHKLNIEVIKGNFYSKITTNYEKEKIKRKDKKDKK